MVRLHVNRHIVVVALLLIGSIFVSFRALADPAVTDNLDGTKTVAWNFSNSSNYTWSNVAMAANNLRLGSSAGEWCETLNSDFAAAGTPDVTVRVNIGSQP